jgi:NAD(P)H-hydrate epimerase
VGRLAVAPVRELENAEGDAETLSLTSEVLLPALRTRNFDTHKGQMGRVAIVAGSKGYLGAAELCSTAALRGGAGLVTLYVKEDIYPMMVTRMPAEVMVKSVKDYREALRDPADVLAVGPGLGLSWEDEILAMITRAEMPVVIDADALNMLARRGFDSLIKSKAPRLLTPHPGEMARLAERTPEWQGLTREKAVRAFVKRFPMATLLLKGSRTVIGAEGQPVAFNTTGQPGMATGGVGDVLTGVCAALIAGGATPFEAACLGSWLNGRAAEIAISTGDASAESLSAGTVLDHLGCAFTDLRRRCF